MELNIDVPFSAANISFKERDFTVFELHFVLGMFISNFNDKVCNTVF